MAIKFRSRPAGRAATAAAAALLIAAGCSDAGDERATLSLQGDSVFPVETREFPGGIQTAECAFTVTASATGPDSMGFTIMQGRVVYTLAETGDTVITRPVEPGAVGDFFDGKVTLRSGGELTSRPQGISMSLPVTPMRGTVTFDYMEDNGAQTRTTEPYSFTCR